MSETQDEKKERLAQALRDNLRRRKAQTRATSAQADTDRNRRRDGDDPAG